LTNIPPPPQGFGFPTEQPKNNTVKIVVLVLLGLFCLCSLGIGGGGWLMYQRVKQGPQPMQGYGKPVRLEKLAGGWTKYKFTDLGLTIELPDAPHAELMDKSAGDFIVKEWTGYSASSDNIGFDMYAYRYAFNMGFSAKDYISSEVDETTSTAKLGSVKHRTTEKTIGGRSAVLLSLSYVEGDDATESECLYFVDKDSVLIVRMSWYAESAKSAKLEVSRIKNSVQFDRI
jgi:hypothetical protein